MRPLLEAIGVGYPGRIGPVSLAVPSGTMLAVTGPNGGGKTSFLRALARIGHPVGRVRVAGEDLDLASPARRRALIGFLPASRDVIWPIRVRDVIALGLDGQDAARVGQLLEQLELSGLADRPVDRLSTGERARVLLARALAPKPQAVLLDEPLSNLEPYWVLQTLALLRQAAADGAAILVAIHDLTLLDRFDRAVLIAGGELMVDGRPEELPRRPEFEQVFRVRPSASGWVLPD